MRGGDERRKRWEDRTTWLFIIASLAFLVAYSWTILEPHRPVAVTVVLSTVLVAVWVAFLVDYLVRLLLSSDKVQFVRKNVVDLASVIIPIARPFRLLREIDRLPILRGSTPSHVRRRVLIVAASFVVMFIYVISLAVYNAERDAPGATILSFGDSVWWACVTMATVGYGDYVPVTVLGRVLAVILMIGGIAIVGTASATIVSYLNEHTNLRMRRGFDQTDAPGGNSTHGDEHPPHESPSHEPRDDEHRDDEPRDERRAAGVDDRPPS